jgi:hypothetical protein
LKKKLELRKDSLTRIKENALHQYKQGSVGRNIDSFLASCWLIAVLDELNRINQCDLEFKIEHLPIEPIE